jgi:hypothetical protein
MPPDDSGDVMRLPRLCTRAGSLLLAGATVLSLAATACTPAQQTGPKTLSGVLRGADGKYVDAMIGFDILDAQGRKIKSNGALVTDGGYGALLRMNWCVGAAGSNDASATCGKDKLTTQWTLQLPPTAVRVYVEAYPKKASSSGWIDNYNGYTGPNPGDNDQSTYGMSYRRSISTLSSVSGVQLTMPKVCGRPGGSTGTLWGYIYRGNTLWRAAGGSTNAWSTEADNAPILGMNEGHVDAGAGTYHITNLQGGSHYTIVATVGGVTKQWLDGPRPVVNACGSTRFDLRF